MTKIIVHSNDNCIFIRNGDSIRLIQTTTGKINARETFQLDMSVEQFKAVSIGLLSSINIDADVLAAATRNGGFVADREALEEALIAIDEIIDGRPIPKEAGELYPFEPFKPKQKPKSTKNVKTSTNKKPKSK